ACRRRATRRSGGCRPRLGALLEAAHGTLPGGADPRFPADDLCPSERTQRPGRPLHHPAEGLAETPPRDGDGAGLGLAASRTEERNPFVPDAAHPRPPDPVARLRRPPAAVDHHRSGPRGAGLALDRPPDPVARPLDWSLRPAD